MVIPTPKKQATGIMAVYTNTTGAIASVANIVGMTATAGEHAAQGLVVSSKRGLLETYRELLQDFGVDTSALTPIEIRAQAEAILNF